MLAVNPIFEADITDELDRRPTDSPDYLEEKRAIQELALRLGEAPAEVLPRFVELAMRLTGGSSAGISIHEADPAPGVFRWHHLIGEMARFDNATTPRNHSPCGVTLDRTRPVLMREVERVYDWVANAGIAIPEVLLVPLFIGSREPIGTLWVIAGEAGHFHGDHARIATELATFVATALRVQRTEKSLVAALEKSETVAHEMSHRVKNLFALVNTMIRFGAKSAKDIDDFSRGLTGRLHALAGAHQLVLAREATAASSEFEQIVRSVIEPHQSQNDLRFKLVGSTMSIKPGSISGLALVFNELATNAIKHGALAADDGTVAISWSADADQLSVRWEERGGAAIEAAPERIGFGSRLLDSTIVRQFGGTISHDWRREGVVVSINLPLRAVAA